MDLHQARDVGIVPKQRGTLRKVGKSVPAEARCVFLARRWMSRQRALLESTSCRLRWVPSIS
jgi:hypothetical protein